MSLRAYRTGQVLFEGDGITTSITFDLRDVFANFNNEGVGFTLESPPTDVSINSSPTGVSVTNHSRYFVTLSFAAAPTVSGIAVGLKLFYEI